MLMDEACVAKAAQIQRAADSHARRYDALPASQTGTIGGPEGPSGLSLMSVRSKPTTAPATVRFAVKSPAGFGGAAVKRAETSPPLLEGALAHLEPAASEDAGIA